jgi:hypothetical protein
MAFLLGAPALHAGRFYLDLIIDPTTPAFDSTPFPPPPPPGGFAGTSTRSGPGTWQLFALDQLDNSFGIQFFHVNLSAGSGGTIPAISNRSPRTSWEDDSGFGDAGFTSIRSGTNANPVTGAQLTTTSPLLGGFGREASNFSAKIPTAYQFDSTLNGKWGDYTSSLGFGSLHPIFLAEGTYTGPPPSIDSGSFVTVYTNANLTAAEFIPQFSTTPISQLAQVPEPSTISLLSMVTIGGLARRRRA